jgi:hypothetical protein
LAPSPVGPRAHEEATQQRLFVAAALHAAGGLDGEARVATEEYLREVFGKTDAAEPLPRSHQVLPDIPTPSEEELRPFL